MAQFVIRVEQLNESAVATSVPIVANQQNCVGLTAPARPAVMRIRERASKPGLTLDNGAHFGLVQTELGPTKRSVEAHRPRRRWLSACH